MRHDSVLKAHVADKIEEALKRETFGTRTDVSRVSPLVLQVKVWEENGPPRYLNVHVKELL